ncbi:MAG: VOC family protein [Gammaproteobacteria bacterium]|nr:VOC family protein [Gammaproteobacteria bacterium]
MPDFPDLPSGFDFHHIGYATRSLQKEQKFFEFLGYQLDGEPFTDSVQGVAGCFVTGSGPRIEILENLPGSSTLTPWLEAGIKMYHFAYFVDDILAAIEWARSNRGKLSVAPVPAIAFDGREICFLMFPNQLMLEFVQR